MNYPMPLTVESQGKTDIGMVRNSNQDAILVRDDLHLFMVADGMGGHAGGEIASSICVTEVEKFIRTSGPKINLEGAKAPDLTVSASLVEAINNASTKIYERALEHTNLKGMGTTATAVRIVDNYAYTAHVGDSRLYLIRCGFIYQMTDDHSLVSEQVRVGILSAEEAANHQLRNVITRSVGYQEEEDVDTKYFQVFPGDILVICSDGLHGFVGNRDITRVVNAEDIKAAEKLVDLANKNGGEDNISAIVIKIKDPL